MNEPDTSPSSWSAPCTAHHGPSPGVACVSIDHLSQAAFLYEPIMADGQIVDLRIVRCNEASRTLPLSDDVVAGALASEVFVDVHEAIHAARVAWNGEVPDRYSIVRRGLVHGAMTTIRYEITTARVGDLLVQTSHDQTVDHQLEESEGRLRSIIESLDEAITISQPLFDEQMRVVDLRTLYRNASAALASDHLRAFVDRGHLAAPLERVRRVLERGSAITTRIDNVEGAMPDVPPIELEIHDAAVGDLTVEVVRNHTERRLATLADERSKRRFAATIDALADAVGIFDPVFSGGAITDFRLVYANQAMSAILGVGDVVSMLSGDGQAFVGLGRRAMSRPGDAMHSSFTGGTESTPRTWRASIVSVDEQLVAVAADVTEMHQALTRVSASEELLRTVLDALSESVRVFARDGTMLYANAASVEILGERAPDGPPPFQMLSIDDECVLPAAEWPLARGRRGEEVDGLVVRVTRPMAPPRTCRFAVRSITDPAAHEPSMVVVSAHDITDERARAEELEWLSTHAKQSRLLNREGLIQRMTERFIEHEAPYAVIWVKLTALDSLRPTFGFAAVDDAVSDAAVRLSAIAAENDGFASHPSENALALVVPDGNRSDASPSFVRDVIARLSAPVAAGSVTLMLEPVAGVARGPARLGDPDTVLHRAKSAAWTAERAGTDHTYWQPDHGSDQVRRMALLGDFERAMHSGEIVLAYQPKFAVPSGRLVGAEALARWTRPGDGPLRPDEFIPAVEASGLARPFTLWAIDRALAQWAAVAAIAPGTTVAVNVPVTLIADAGFAREVGELLGRRGTAAGTLRLEITERTIGDHAQTITAGIDRLAELGVSISIDDFGTGQSSLAYLRHLPVAEVKVDRTFVSGAGTNNDPVSLSVLRACADIGRAAGISVCAEGVETDDELQAVTTLGFHTVQGFLTGRPAPIDRMLAAAAGSSATITVSDVVVDAAAVVHQSVGR